jgi:hypothetical protein
MTLHQMCLFGHVHVYIKYPHYVVHEIKMTIGHVNQLVDNSVTQGQINILPLFILSKLGILWKGYGY